MSNSFFSLLMCLTLLASFGATEISAAVKKKVPVAVGHRPGRRVVVGKGRARTGATATRTAQTWRNRQAAPSTDRYREIQTALVEKGYLKSEPNGVWDAQSTEALKQFQTDQKLSPTGKINSSSLIGLGLGPKRSELPATLPPGTTPNEPLTPEPIR